MTKNIEFTELGIKLPPQIVDDLTRREFLIGAGLIALAPGCGSGEEEGASGRSQTRAVKHAMGETEVPVRPERVITLDDFSLDTAINVGLKPVGSVFGRTSGLGEELESVERVGDESGFSIERVLALEPDLILGITDSAEQQYPELSEVAPTVLYNFDNSGEWKRTFRFYADALNRTDRAEEVLADYEARTAEIRRKLEGGNQAASVSILNVTPELFYLYLPDSFPGTIVKDAGLSRPEGQRGTGFVREISRELVGEAEADVMFLIPSGFAGASEESGDLQELREDPLWRRLEVVRNERVYEVDQNYWLGSGVTAANLILDDLEKHLLEESSG